MAEHMLQEAPARLEQAFLAETVPAVHAWYTRRTAPVAPGEPAAPAPGADPG
jgi:hypothetical protein